MENSVCLEILNLAYVCLEEYLLENFDENCIGRNGERYLYKHNVYDIINSWSLERKEEEVDFFKNILESFLLGLERYQFLGFPNSAVRVLDSEIKSDKLKELMVIFAVIIEHIDKNIDFFPNIPELNKQYVVLEYKSFVTEFWEAVSYWIWYFFSDKADSSKAG